MRVADVHVHDPVALAVLDNLNMGQRARNAVAHSGKPATTPFASRAIGYSEYLWKQTLIAGFAIGEQNQVVTIGKSLRCIA